MVSFVCYSGSEKGRRGGQYLLRKLAPFGGWAILNGDSLMVVLIHDLGGRSGGAEGGRLSTGLTWGEGFGDGSRAILSWATAATLGWHGDVGD